MFRVPDLWRILPESDLGQYFASVNKISYSDTDGFLAIVNSEQFEAFKDSYIDVGYEVTRNDDLSKIRCSSEKFSASFPQFMHEYVNKMFGSIPTLYLIKPVQKDIRLSELAIVYMLAYVLGMLTRYFPTHWVALHSGTRGDGLWPTIHAAQSYVETVFPELVVELIQDNLANIKEVA